MEILIGDLILFKGNGLFSKIIMAAPGADYSHVGLYVEHDNQRCLFESTSQGDLPDIITGEPIKGVQLVPLEERVKGYDGEVFHRPIIGSRSKMIDHILKLMIAKHHGKPYEKSMRELANAELDLPLPWELNKEDDTSLFCSETAALVLRAMGIMRETNKPSNEFTPTDFSKDIILNAGYSFDDIIQLK